MANRQNQSAGSQGASGPGQSGGGAWTGPGPGDGDGDDQRSGAHEYIELPEHQGVIIDYIPPRGGMRTEVGDVDADDETDNAQARDW